MITFFILILLHTVSKIGLVGLLYILTYSHKCLCKTTCYKTKSNFSQFFCPHWLLQKRFFSFLIKAFANFEKLIRFHLQSFSVYKDGENLKMLIEMFRQKLVVSNVILAFLDHLKWKFSLSANHGGQHWAPPLFKISGSAPAKHSVWSNKWFKNQMNAKSF